MIGGFLFGVLNGTILWKLENQNLDVVVIV